MGRTRRSYKTVWGIAYTNVQQGESHTTEITANRDDREQLYNDPAVRLSEGDLDSFKSLKGKPICKEHDPNVVLGHIHGYKLGEDGHLRVMSRIYTDTPEGRQAAEDIENGRLNGYSVGYTTSVHPGTNQVASKTFNELTLTREPFFDQCNVTVRASRKKKNLPTSEATYKREVLWVQLSKGENMTDTATAPPAVPTPAPAESAPPKSALESDAGALLKMADGLQDQVDEAKSAADKDRETVEELKRKLAEAEKVNAEAAKANAYLSEFMQREKEEYAKAKRAEAEDIVKTQEEMHGGPFSEEARQEMIRTVCSKDPQDQADTKILCSQVQSFKNEKELRIKSEQAYAELQSKLAAKEKEMELVQQRINASRHGMREIYQHDKEEEAMGGAGEEEDDLEVNASRGMASDSFFPYRGDVSDFVLIPQPSATDRKHAFYRQLTPATANTLEVQASKAADGTFQGKVRTARRHALMDEVPFSQRNSRTAHWFHRWVEAGDAMTAGIEVKLHALPFDKERRQ